MFKHMEESITRQLTREQMEFNHHDPDIRRQDVPAHVAARSIIQLLIASGFQFEQLLTMAKTRGLRVLELELRTGFLKQMSGQSRTVMDRSVLGTRMVVEYFRIYGNMSLQQIAGVTHEEDGYQGHHQPSQQVPDIPQTSTSSGDFTQLEAFLSRKFDRSPEMRRACQMSINILEESRFTPEFLIERHRAGGNTREWLTSQIERIRLHCSPANVNLISRSISDWCHDQARLGVRSRKDIDR